MVRCFWDIKTTTDVQQKKPPSYNGINLKGIVKEALYEQYRRGLRSGSGQRYDDGAAIANDDESRHDGKRQHDADDSYDDDDVFWWQQDVLMI